MAEDSQQDDQTQDDAAEAISADAAGTSEPGAEAAQSDETTSDETTSDATPTGGDVTVASPTDSGRPPAPTTGASEGDEGRPNRRKVREGLVVSIKMDKTAVVGVVERVRHPRYVKTVQRTKKLYAHDPQNDLRVGDRVRVAETRPLSRLKRWRVVEVLERAK